MPDPRFQPPAFTGFTEAYRSVLDLVHNQPRYVTSARGIRSRERLHIAFTLDDPRQRIPAIDARRFNIVFSWAETLWYLAGRRDLEMVSYYAPSLAGHSADGAILTGTAYGPRLFGPTVGESAWRRAVDELGLDQDTKRAVIPILRGSEIGDPSNGDVACTIAVQFLNRGNALHTVTTMRANDAYRGLAGDVFAFTTLAEFTAIQVGLPLGSYTHQVTSMHVNEEDRYQVEKTLAGQARDYRSLPMPPDTTWDTLAEVARWETLLRHNGAAVQDPEEIKLPPYWRQVVLLFDLYRQIIHTPTAWITCEHLNPLNRWLVQQRWPERIQGARS